MKPPKSMVAKFAISLACCFASTPALATGFAIVTEQSFDLADTTSHEIASGGVVLGVSDKGGGYINKLVLPGIGDVIGKHAARYGRGGQVALRDGLHDGVYNPTQAGFTDSAGSPCSVEKISAGKLFVPQRPVALWNGDGKYDFTEWENLAADPYTDDGGDSDRDGIDEASLPDKQAGEITSEFDLIVTYENAMDGVDVKIPAFRFGYEFRFVRTPGHALKQFGKGTRAYRAGAARSDRSRLAPAGDHPSGENSLTDIALASTVRGDKSVWDPKYAFVLTKDGSLELLKPPTRRAFFRHGKCSNGLIVMSRDKNPDAGPAIGYYQPCNSHNIHGVVGRKYRDGTMEYSDDRIVDGKVLANDARTPGMWLMGVNMEYTGLLNNSETPPGIYEAIRGESFILVGTPNEIVAATKAIGR